MRTDTRAFATLLSLPLTQQARGAWETALLDGFGAVRYLDVFALLDLILDHDLAAAGRITALGTDQLYLDAIVQLVKSCPLIDGIAALGAPRRLHRIDQRYDFFHAVRDEMTWSLLRCMNFLYRAKLRPANKIAIVTSIRNEGINIIEWLAHHRRLGIDDFIIYANDNDDESSALLSLLAAQDVIHLIWNETDLGKDGGNMFPIQAKVFGHACDFLQEARNFEWLLFSDMDEFLVTRPLWEAPEAPRPLDDLFARLAAMQPAPAAISFHWKWFTSQCAFRRAAGLNFERFQYWAASDHVKTIVKSGRCLSFSTSHLPRMPAGDIVLDGNLETATVPGFRMKPVYGYGQINHYWNKSFEEFIGKHLRVRGDRTFQDFFDYGSNRWRGHHEAVPAAWLRRVRQEMAALWALPGAAAALAAIEAAFVRQLAAFDRQHDSEALFYRHFVKEIGRPL